MSTICPRCALRLRAAASLPTPARRAFSASSSKRARSLPQFTPTSQPELDGLLASLREKWLIPAALTQSERNLIFKPRNEQRLIDNQETATIGEEEIDLRYLDQIRDMPSLKKELIPKIIASMAQGEKSDWNNLPALLVGLKNAKQTPRDDVMGKIARKAIEAGQMGIILRCLQQAEHTQMLLSKEGVLESAVQGLRQVAQREQWSEAATSKALRDANEIAMLLEDEKHRSSSMMDGSDPRTRPEILAVFLELAAVYAHQHQDKKDVDGKVRVYAERLLSNMQALKESGKEGEIKASMRPKSHVPAAVGPQMEILRGVPIYHGLQIAMKILGKNMPQRSMAQQVVQNWENGLKALTEGVREQAKVKAGGLNRWPASGTHGWAALKAWRSCLTLD